MSSLMAVWRIFAGRGTANWPLLAVLGLGVLVASTLLAAGPIYSRAMSDLGLKFTIEDELAEAPATRILVPESELGTADGIAFRQALESQIDNRLGWFRHSQSLYVVLGTFFVEDPDPTVPREALPFVGRPQSLSGYEMEVGILAGRLPQRTQPGEPLEVAIGPAVASLADLEPGSLIRLAEEFDTCERVIVPLDPPPDPIPCDATSIVEFSFDILITGVIEPIDEDSRFWPSRPAAYFNPLRMFPDTAYVLPMFMVESVLLSDIGARFPAYQPEFTWHVFPESEELDRSNFERAIEEMDLLADDVAPLGGFVIRPLKSTLEDFDLSSRHKEAPLLILLLELSGVALFYVLLMALVVVERQAGEISLLRGRGATSTQVTAVYLLDGLLVGIPVLLAAPLLAGVVTSLLGLLPPFEEINGGEMLPITIPPTAFLLATLGVLLALVALAVPVFFAARRGVIAERGAMSRPSPSVLQRYYLDLVIAAVAGLLLWELNERGSVFTADSAVGLSSDPLLLASPALLILAAAALLLRIVPLALRVVSWLSATGSGVAGAVGLWQVARNPGQYTRLALLLMMAVAVGTFAASYSSTTDRSYRDRALFQTGVEFRAESPGTSMLGKDGPGADARLTDLNGVAAVSAVTRLEISPTTAGRSRYTMQLLGVNPVAAAGLIWSRDDFADRPIEELLLLLGGPGEFGGHQVEGDPDVLSIWIYSEESRDDVNVWVRIRDAERRYGLVQMGDLSGTGWRELTGQIHDVFARGVEAPITLVSVLFTEPANRPSSSRTPVYVDDIRVLHNSGESEVLDDFEGGFNWAVLPGDSTPADTFERSTEQSHLGLASGKYSLNRTLSTGTRGFFVAGPNIPLPALVSESFLDATGAGVGSRLSMSIGDVVIPIEVRETYRLFPTLPSYKGASLVVNRDHLQAYLHLVTSVPPFTFNEGWFELEDDVDIELFEESLRGMNVGLRRTFDATSALESVSENPLIAAGGSAILLVAFGALLLLVAVALLVSLWVAVQRRRAEFAVMRAMGLSRLQVLRQLTYEYAVVGVMGLVAGTYVGLLVGERMLSFLNVTDEGRRVEPPFILQTDWTAVFIGGGAVLIAFAAALAVAVVSLSRTSDAAALRQE